MFERKENTKAYCATCKREIMDGEAVAISTDKNGVLRLHHKLKEFYTYNPQDPIGPAKWLKCKPIEIEIISIE